MKVFASNLVCVTVPDMHGNDLEININTTLLTDIIYKSGLRLRKDATAAIRLRSIYDKKYPFKSKFYVPFSLWKEDPMIADLYREWRPASVRLFYQDKLFHLIEYKNNEDAKRTANMLNNLFWNKL